MSKKFKSQASSSRAAAGGFGSSTSAFGGFSSATTQETTSSSLSYISEPPDFSGISEPQVVVAFKNLSKKDSVTKAKALEELQDFVSALGAQSHLPEAGFLDVWIKLYPRTSIDTSLRVRQLAHTLQGYIVSISGKRIARLVPRVIGAWLAGLYDNDTLVLRAAQDSIIRAFPTEEKRRGVWKVYQSAILEFVVDAVLEQTPLTLSDERSTSPDDIEAKYCRVVATATQVFNRLLAKASPSDLEKDASSVEAIFSNKSFWGLSSHQDPFVRRSIYDLLRTVLATEQSSIDWKLISTAFLSKSLSISQTGSATKYSELLLTLTEKRPQLWTSDYSSKTSATKRIYQYVKRGSEGANRVYWQNLARLLQSLPIEVLFSNPADSTGTAENANKLMEDIHDGAISRDEPRMNLEAAYLSYIDIGLWMSSVIGDKGLEHKFLDTHICPILRQYILAQPEESRWTVPENAAVNVCGSCFLSLAERTGIELLAGLWTQLSKKLMEAIKASAPEKSQNFKASQDSICSQSKRMFDLEAEILARTSSRANLSFIADIFKNSAGLLLSGSLEVLRSRNGKPYSAASVAEGVARLAPLTSIDLDEIDTFLAEDIPTLLFSPSADRLMSILFQCRGRKGFEAGFISCLDALLCQDWGSSPVPAIRQLFSFVTQNEISEHSQFESIVTKCLYRALKGDGATWDDIIILLNNSASQGELSDRVFSGIIDNLSSDVTSMEALRGLSDILSQSAEAIRTFVNSPNGSKLVSKLVYLTESPVDEIAHASDALGKELKDIMHGATDVKSSTEIIHHNFDEVGPDSLSIDALVEIARGILEKSSLEDRGQLLARLLPSKDQWNAALDRFLRTPPNQSAAITSSLGGAVYLVDRTLPETLQRELETIPRDSSHYTSAFRLAFYVTNVLSTSSLESIESSTREIVLFYLPLTIQLIDDDVSIERPGELLFADIPEIRDECVDLVSQARLMIKSWIETESAGAGKAANADAPGIIHFWEKQLELLQHSSPYSYRLAEASVRILSEQDALGPVSSAEALFRLAKSNDSPSNPFTLASTVAGLKGSIANTPFGIRLCNELVADLTGLNSDKEAEGLRKLVTLNLLTQGENTVAQKVPTQRLMFLVKNLSQCLESERLSPGLTSEILKTLTTVFPLIKEMYGSHWTIAFDFLKSLWDKSNAADEYMPVLHSSLRLFTCLKSLANDESNDDLEDAWIAAQKTHPPSLIRLLTGFDSSFSYDQPRNITADLLARQISGVPVDSLDNMNELFSVLSLQNRGVQRAAYDVLHRAIPKAQEELSVDAALTGTVEGLPDELLSMLFEAPTISVMSQAHLDDGVWLDLRSYLLSWKTVFDHFTNASLLVRARYVANIKENNCIGPLLDFAFDFLQYPQVKLIDATRFDIRAFELDQSETAEKETQWLLVHLYYLCLTHMPNLTKSWWIDSKNRIKGSVETWTEKYISPLIVEDSLRSVSEWFSSQNWSGEEYALQVKFLPKTAEIIASIDIEEELPPSSMAISLPSSYPLQPAIVTGRHRVAVDEKKWKSWMIIIQGVIMFSNGSLIDGLMTFRKNVQGALKGQGECAICYSVISTDMQTANRRCSTCKNTFHSDCLYRWFKSSNASSCPLCRTSFHYS